MSKLSDEFKQWKAEHPTAYKRATIAVVALCLGALIGIWITS